MYITLSTRDTVPENKTYFYSDTTFRDCISADNLDGAKLSISNGGKYPVKSSEIIGAAKRGYTKCLHWLVEELKIPIDESAIPYTLLEGRLDIVMYLLQHNAPFTAESLQVIFMRYRKMNKVTYHHGLESYLDITNEDGPIRAKLIVALCSKFNIPITESDIRQIISKLCYDWINCGEVDELVHDVIYILVHHKIPITDARTRAYLILLGVKSGLMIEESLEKLRTVVDMPNEITMQLLRECFDIVPSKHLLLMANNEIPNRNVVRTHFLATLKGLRPIIDIPDRIPNIDTVQEFEMLCEHITFSREYLFDWLYETLQYLNIEICRKIISILVFDSNLAHALVIKALVFRPELFDFIIETVGWTKYWAQTIRWVDCVKRFGLEACKEVLDDVSKFKHADLINFSEAQPSDYTEYWNWNGVNMDMSKFTTYNRDDYIPHPISDKFKNILTLQDLAANEWINDELIQSPTACYFDLDGELGPEVFYRDQQDCIIWALDAKTGYVYIFDDDRPYTRCYTARSLPEFLSHIYDNSKAWYESKRY